VICRIVQNLTSEDWKLTTQEIHMIIMHSIVVLREFQRGIPPYPRAEVRWCPRVNPRLVHHFLHVHLRKIQPKIQLLILRRLTQHSYQQQTPKVVDIGNILRMQQYSDITMSISNTSPSSNAKVRAVQTFNARVLITTNKVVNVICRIVQNLTSEDWKLTTQEIHMIIMHSIVIHHFHVLTSLSAVSH